MEAKNAESIRGAGLRGQRGQAVCDEAVRMVNLARRCGALRLRNAGFSDYPFITARLFKLVISHQSSDQPFCASIPAVVKVSAQNAFVVFGGAADTCEAEQDNKYAKRRAHEFHQIAHQCVGGVGFAGLGASG